MSNANRTLHCFYFAETMRAIKHGPHFVRCRRCAAFVRRWKGEATLPHEHCSICETRPSRSLSLFRQSKSEIDTPGKALGTEGSDKRIEVPGAQGLELEEEVKGKKENLP